MEWREGFERKCPGVYQDCQRQSSQGIYKGVFRNVATVDASFDEQIRWRQDFNVTPKAKNI